MKMQSLRSNLYQEFITERKFYVGEFLSLIEQMIPYYGPDMVLYTDSETDVLALVYPENSPKPADLHNVEVNPSLTLKQWKECLRYSISEHGEFSVLKFESKTPIEFYLSEMA